MPDEVSRERLKKVFEKVEQFKYLGRNLTDQNSIQEGIKSILKSGNACYHSVQNILSSRFLSENANVYRTITVRVALHECEIVCLHWGRNLGWGCLRIECWGEYLDLRGTRYHGSGESYLMRSLMTCTPHQLLFGWTNREEWDGRGM